MNQLLYKKSFVTITLTSSSFNSQFHRLSQRSASTIAPRKGSKKNFQKNVVFMGKSCVIARVDKKELVGFFTLLIVSGNG